MNLSCINSGSNPTLWNRVLQVAAVGTALLGMALLCTGVVLAVLESVGLLPTVLLATGAFGLSITLVCKIAASMCTREPMQRPPRRILTHNQILSENHPLPLEVSTISTVFELSCPLHLTALPQTESVEDLRHKRAIVYFTAVLQQEAQKSWLSRVVDTIASVLAENFLPTSSSHVSPLKLGPSAPLVDYVQDHYLGKIEASYRLGTDFNLAIGSKFRTPLALACAQNPSENTTASAKFLLANGADPSICDADGYLPIHWAAKAGSVEILELLLAQKGQDIHARDNNGNTPLHLAAEAGELATVVLLLQLGADPNLLNNNGFFAFELAQQAKHSEIGSLLEARRPGLFDDLAILKVSEIVQVILSHLTFWELLQLRLVNKWAKSEADLTLKKRAIEYGVKKSIDEITSGLAIDFLGNFLSNVLRLANGLEMPSYSIVRNPSSSTGVQGSVNADLTVRNIKSLSGLEKEEFRSVLVPLMLRYVEANNLSMIEALFYLQTDSNRKNDSLPSLCLAAERGKAEMVRLLINFGAEVDSRSSSTDTALARTFKSRSISDENARLATMRVLLLAKADPNIPTVENDILLHMAIRKGDVNSVVLLVKHGANMDVLSPKGQTALCCAIESQNIENPKQEFIQIVKVLLEAGADPNIASSDGANALHKAVYYGYFDIVTLLLNYRAKIDTQDAKGHSAFYYAFYIRNHSMPEGMAKRAPMVFLLLQGGANPNSNTDLNKTSPLHLAAEIGSMEIVNQLLSYGANINVQDTSDYTPLILACSGRYDAWLIGGGSELDYLNCIESLLMNGASQDIAANNGSYPIHFAAQYGLTKVVKLLLDYKAKIDGRGHEGLTPLAFACTKYKKDHDASKNKECIEFLLKQNANANIPANNGCLPIHFAAQAGLNDILALLVDYGSDIHARDNNGNTPLHLAAEAGKLETVVRLLELGADPNVLNNNGVLAFELAQQAKHSEIGSLLEARRPGLFDDVAILTATEIVQVILSHLTFWELLQLRLVNKWAKSEADLTFKKRAIEYGIERLMDDMTSELARSYLKTFLSHVLDFANRSQLPEYALMRNPSSLPNELGSVNAEMTVRKMKHLNPMDEAGLKLTLSTTIATYAREQNIGKIKTLCHLGADFNLNDIGLPSSLGIAAENLDLELVKFMLYRGVLADQRSTKEDTALCRAINTSTKLASEERVLEIVALLLASGANPNTLSLDGNAPLHLAAEKHYPKVVSLLLDRGADIDVLGKDNETALSIAFHKVGFSALEIQKECMEIIFILLKKGANLTFNLSGSLVHALNIAAFCGLTQLVDLFLSKGVDIEIQSGDGVTPLYMAFCGVIMVELALAKGAQVKEDPYICVKFLLEKRANPNCFDNQGNFPIHLGAKVGLIKGVGLLLDYGANINAMDAKLRTPLALACEEDSKEINYTAFVKFLLERGADPSSRDIDGCLPIHLAAKAGSVEILKLLLRQKGEDINDADFWGNTPLHLAVEANKLDTIKFLLSLGADPKLKNNNKLSAIDLAHQAGNSEIESLLSSGLVSQSSIGEEA